MGTANPEESKMSFWSHLDELRKRIVYICIAIGVGFIACFNSVSYTHLTLPTIYSV